MHLRKPTVLALALALCAVIAGCQDMAEPGTSKFEGSYEPLSQALPDNHIPNLDEMYADIARNVPGFAGAYVDTLTNELHVRLVDEARGVQAEEAIKPFLERHAADNAIRHVHADYDFLELFEWKKSITRDILPLAGVHAVDIDETRNRMWIGISDGIAISAVQAKLKELGIPRRAVELGFMNPIETAVGHPSNRVAPVPATSATTLRMEVSPTAGGILIWGEGIPEGTDCTLGFNATVRDHNGVETLAFATNSHCSNSRGQLDNRRYQQPATTHNLIGQEFFDDLWSASVRSSICGNPPNTLCRYSDFSLAAYEPGIDVRIGEIARPTYRGRYNGSVTIDGTRQRFMIRAVEPVIWLIPPAGRMIEKVGQRTGWTYGYMDRACVNVERDADVGDGKHLYLCQNRVTGGADEGDSGSPVFYHHGSDSYGTDVTLAGILWGVEPSRREFWYSSYIGMENDLAFSERGPWRFISITTTAQPPPPDPPPLRVYIRGPDSVRPGSYCRWWADVSGGMGSYQYQWSNLLSGSGSEIWGSVTRTGYLDLRVTDGQPETVTAAKRITVSWSAPRCEEVF